MRQLVKDADVIIPLAAVVGAPACDRDPWLTRAVNLDAIKFLNQIRSPRQLVIYPNTNSGYGTRSGEVATARKKPRWNPFRSTAGPSARPKPSCWPSPNTITLRLATVFGTSPRMRLDLLVNHFVYVAVTDGYIIIFEKDFKRNFVHIRDVADCFLHCIAHAPQMIGRPYNVGLDSANVSKETLAKMVQKHVPRFRDPFLRDRRRSGQTRLHRLESAAARSRLRSPPLAGRRHPGVDQRLSHDGPLAPQERLTIHERARRYFRGGSGGRIGDAAPPRTGRLPQDTGPRQREAVPGLPAGTSRGPRTSRRGALRGLPQRTGRGRLRTILRRPARGLFVRTRALGHGRRGAAGAADAEVRPGAGHERRFLLPAGPAVLLPLARGAKSRRHAASDPRARHPSLRTRASGRRRPDLGFRREGRSTTVRAGSTPGSTCSAGKCSRRFPEQTAVSLERETFPALLGRGLYGCPSETPFLDIGTPASYAAAEEFFSAERRT